MYVLVYWCGAELWVDQRKKCVDICDVAQVTDIRMHDTPTVNSEWLPGYKLVMSCPGVLQQKIQC